MRPWIAIVAAIVLSIVAASSCQSPQSAATEIVIEQQLNDDKARHAQLVMTSRFCAECHPAIYAEHAQNTHGRAFTDEEVRLATGRFDHGDCIRCHTPRPIFETGIGKNPIRRYHNLEEGNTCMTCHWKEDYDYGSFQGGMECTTAFDDRVGTVDACASCHRNHGTPYQWEVAPNGKAAGRTCMSCHMERVKRPVAVGEEPRMVRSHVFPGVRSEKQVRRAYSYDARVEGNEVVVRIKNKGAAHHFPTELKQRAVESLIVVRDANGKELYRSRMVCRDPYKRPYGLKLPVNTQIRPGETREHRVPLKVAEGTIDCELHLKHYFPIEDHHPTLARQLEAEKLEFSGVTPSSDEVESDAGAKWQTPEGIAVNAASPANLVDLQPWVQPDGVEVPIPEGESQEDITKFIQLFQFPVPEGNRIAQRRLAEIGMPAVPQLIEALSSWDNKTFKQASMVLKRIGKPAVPAILEALSSDDLYVRYNARHIIKDTDPGSFLDEDSQDLEMRKLIVASLRKACDSKNALDRRSALELATELQLEELRDLASRHLRDAEPDVVTAAAACLAANKDKGVAESDIQAIEAAMKRTIFPETERMLALTLAELGNPNGIPRLLAGLEHNDDLIREDYFESLFMATGVHHGFNPFAPSHERLAAIGRLQAWWAEEGGVDALRWIERVPGSVESKAWGYLSKFADGKHDNEELAGKLTELGSQAVPALVRGLKYPPGFADRRMWICESLRRIGSPDAAPALAQALNDPVLRVADWACFALQACGDEAVLPALIHYRDRIKSLNAAGRIPNTVNFDEILARVERTMEMFE